MRSTSNTEQTDSGAESRQSCYRGSRSRESVFGSMLEIGRDLDSNLVIFVLEEGGRREQDRSVIMAFSTSCLATGTFRVLS